MFRFDRKVEPVDSLSARSYRQTKQRYEEKRKAERMQQAMDEQLAGNQGYQQSAQSQNKGFFGKIAEKVADAKSAIAEAEDMAFDAMLREEMRRENVVEYYNDRVRENSNYTMTVRQKNPSGGGSKELLATGWLDKNTVKKVQENPGVFIEGHVRDNRGLSRDIYDADHPDEIRCDHYGRIGVIGIDSLQEAREEKRRRQMEADRHNPILPQYTEHRIDLDIPISRKDDGNGHGGFGE